MIDPHLVRVRCATAAIVVACLAVLTGLTLVDIRADEEASTYGFDATRTPTYVTSASADPSVP